MKKPLRSFDLNLKPGESSLFELQSEVSTHDFSLELTLFPEPGKHAITGMIEITGSSEDGSFQRFVILTQSPQPVDFDLDYPINFKSFKITGVEGWTFGKIQTFQETGAEFIHM